MNVVIVGGCGRVGLPLGLALADAGLTVTLLDRDTYRVEAVSTGRMPFDEPGAERLLGALIPTGRLQVTTDPATVGTPEVVVLVIGTPVDEHLNPDPNAVPAAIRECHNFLSDGQLLVLRSTVFPGVTAMVSATLERDGFDMDVAFCPERLLEGRALEELHSLPQLVGGCNPRATKRAGELFRLLAPEVVEVSPEEAELAKLLTNAWRYIKFATANQFYTIANDFGIDFERVRQVLSHNYPRAADMPRAGFAAGPCLFKDTAQLAAFNNNNFTLGYAAMQVNEGLPLYVVSRMESRHDLASLTVGILGMAFKGDSDDTRSSLSYKLKRILRFKAREVLTTDPFVKTDQDLVTLDEVLRRADVLVVAAPHSEYQQLDTELPIIDIWGIAGAGVRV